MAFSVDLNLGGLVSDVTQLLKAEVDLFNTAFQAADAPTKQLLIQRYIDNTKGLHALLAWTSGKLAELFPAPKDSTAPAPVKTGG